LAGAEHDDRGTCRLHRLQRRPEGRSRSRLRPAAPEARCRPELAGLDARPDSAEEEVGSTAMSTVSPVEARIERDGALLRLRLARPKANLVDAAMIAALHGALIEYRKATTLRGVLLDSEGPHFSFGASVEEHLPA